MSDKWILDGHEPKRVGLMEWADWFERTDDERRVALTTCADEWRVSTVFLGIDHGFGRGGQPLLFETMIFGGSHDGYQERYSTWAEAEAGHALALELLAAGRKDTSPT